MIFEILGLFGQFFRGVLDFNRQRIEKCDAIEEARYVTKGA